MKTNPSIGWCMLSLGLMTSHVRAATITVDDDGPADHATIQAAVAAASSGDTIQISNGTYVLAGTLNVNKSLTINGESEEGVVIDASANGASWGIHAHADGISLGNFTVLPPVSPPNNGGYAIHAAYEASGPGPYLPYTGLTMSNITIENGHRTSFDVHGYDNVVLDGLTAKGNIRGNGIQLSGCDGAVITGCETSGNAWGGIAFYASKSANLNRPSTGISFDFSQNSIGEFVYAETEQALVNSVSVVGSTFRINNAYNPGSSSMHVFTDGDLAKATSLALGLNAKYANTSTVLKDSGGGTLVVPGLSIQAAVDAAVAGDTISLTGAHTLQSTVSVTKQLTLDGGDAAETTISGSFGSPASHYMLFTGSSGGSTVSNLSFEKTDKTGPQNLIGMQTPGLTFRDCIFSGQYVLGDPDVSRAFEISSGASGFSILDCEITGLRQPAYINAVSSGLVQDNHVAGTRGWVVDGGLVTFTGNTWGSGPDANAVDIALLASTPFSPLYDPISTLISNNNGASISNQRAGIQVLNVTQSTGYPTIQAAIAAAAGGDTIEVYPGTFHEDVAVNKSVTLQGSGAGVTTISGPVGGAGATVQISASNVTVDGFTITRAGNNPTDWNDPGLNFAGVAIQGQTLTGTVISNNEITGNRTAIDVNHSNGHVVRNNVIHNNHTGLIFRNQTDGMVVEENSITDNRTVGVLFLAANTTNNPLQQALGGSFHNNDISGNWYGQIVDRQAGGSIPAPGGNMKNFEGNWLGTTSPVVTTANSAEPGYSSLLPVVFGGTATAPGGQPDVAGPASANLDFAPFLAAGTDTDVETTPGRGTFGFQGDTSDAIDGLIGNVVIGGDEVFSELFMPSGSSVSILPGGSLTVDSLELAPGATLEVNGGDLDLGDGSVISGTFTIFNSFGSWNVNGDTVFNVSQSLALVSEIHVASGKTITVNGGGELIFDGCIIDSQTPGSPYNLVSATDGLLTMARCVVTDAAVDINTTLSGNQRSRLFDNRFNGSDIEASAVSKVYHNLFDAATAAAANTDGTVAFDAVDGWGNVTDPSLLENLLTLGFEAPVDPTRTLDAAGNLFVQPSDGVVMKIDVSSLGTNTITAAEALLGYNSSMLVPTGAPTKVSPEAAWEVIVENAPPASGLGIVDSALGLQLAAGEEGSSSDATIATVAFDAGSPGATLGFFRVQTDNQFNPDGSLVRDTRLTRSAAGVPSLLSAFTANTGELIIDDQPPAISGSGQLAHQEQPSAGNVDAFDPASHVLRGGSPLVVSFTASDSGLAGLDAADAANDLVFSASNGVTTLDVWTVATSEASGVVTYTVTLPVPATATNGTYAVTASVIDRSGNGSPVAALGSFVIANEVLATVELEGFAGGTRSVLFAASDASGAVLTTWSKAMEFTGATGSVALEDVPAGTSAISAKTAWNLRGRQSASFSPEGVATVSLTGADLLPAGDLNGDNVVNTLDYSILRYHWLTNHDVADLTGDTIVNVGDYTLIRENFYTVGDPQ